MTKKQKKRYEYDLAGNLKTVTDWRNNVTKYSYTPLNQLTKLENPDGSIVDKYYDCLGNICNTQTTDKSGKKVKNFAYTYDDTNRLVYEVDILGTEVTTTESQTSSHTEDDEEESDSDDPDPSEEQTQEEYSDENEVSSVDETTTEEEVSEESEESLEETETTQEQTLPNKRPISEGFTLEEATLETDIELVDEVVDTIKATDADYIELTSTYCYDRQFNNLLVRYNSDGTVEKYVYGNGLISSETVKDNNQNEGQYKLYHYDIRGSVTSITNKAGKTVAQYSYSTYGIRTTIKGSNSEVIGYNGRDGVLTDPTDLLYMRARYYCSEIKRFINQDVIVGDIANSNSLNRYAYVEGNPVSMVDPFGLCPSSGIVQNSRPELEPYGNCQMSNTPAILREEIQTLKKIIMIASLVDMGYSLVESGINTLVSKGIIKRCSEFELAGYGITVGAIELEVEVDGAAVAVGAIKDLSAILGAGVVGIASDNVGNEGGKNSVPNPNGKKGGVAHQNTINSIENTSANGKIQYESKYNTPNGYKQSRYADAVEIVDGEVTKIHQVGKVNKNGTPVMRESKAIEDIMNSPDYNGAPIYFWPYNNPNMGPIIFDF